MDWPSGLQAGARSATPGVWVMSRTGPCFTGTVRISPWASTATRTPVGLSATASTWSATLSRRGRTSGRSPSAVISSFTGAAPGVDGSRVKISPSRSKTRVWPSVDRLRMSGPVL